MVYGRNTRPFSDGVVGKYSSGKWYTYILPCKEKVAKETRIRIADNKRRNVRDLEDLCSRFNGYAFEEYCAALFCAEGYDAQMTYKSGDGSADIILKTPTEDRVIAECKCYKKKRGKTIFFARVRSSRRSSCAREMLQWRSSAFVPHGGRLFENLRQRLTLRFW